MKKQHRTQQQAEMYTSPVLERFMSLKDPERERKVEKLMELGERIYLAMKAKYGDKHGAKKAFADAIGKSQSEISKWINGTHNFTAETLFAIEEHLGIMLLATGAPPQDKEVVKYVTVIVPADSPAQQIAVPQESEDWQSSQSFTLQGVYTVRLCKNNQFTEETLVGSIYGKS